MSQQNRTGLAGPAIAVAIIAVCFVAYQFWFMPQPSPSPKSEPTVPATEAVPKPEPIPAQSTTELGEAPIARDWGTYHGGPDLTGYSDTVLPDVPVVLWQHMVEGDVRQPVVSDKQGLYVATTNGWITALDFAGSERWKRRLTRKAEDGAEKPERLDAPISCFRSTVLIGSIAGTVYALDAATGDIRWTFSVGGEVLGAINCYVPDDASDPALAFAIERGEGVLHCLNVETGTEVWRTDPIARTDGSMAVTNGYVAFGSCDYAIHVYGAKEGRRISTVALCADCQVASGPALIGDELYSGSRSGHLYRIDAKSGSIVWTNETTTKEVFTTPALGKDVAVFGGEDGNVYCLERGSGSQRWRFESNGLPTSATIASDKVVVGIDGELVVLRLDAGTEVWRYEVSDGIASPSIINGMVVVGSEDGTIAAFGPQKQS